MQQHRRDVVYRQRSDSETGSCLWMVHDTHERADDAVELLLKLLGDITTQVAAVKERFAVHPLHGALAPLLQAQPALVAPRPSTSASRRRAAFRDVSLGVA